MEPLADATKQWLFVWRRGGAGCCRSHKLSQNRSLQLTPGGDGIFTTLSIMNTIYKAMSSTFEICTFWYNQGVKSKHFFLLWRYFQNYHREIMEMRKERGITFLLSKQKWQLKGTFLQCEAKVKTLSDPLVKRMSRFFQICKIMLILLFVKSQNDTYVNSAGQWSTGRAEAALCGEEKTLAKLASTASCVTWTCFGKYLAVCFTRPTLH